MVIDSLGSGNEVVNGGMRRFNCWGTCVPCLPACIGVILLAGLWRSGSDTMIYSTEVRSWGSARIKAGGVCEPRWRLQMTKMTAHITRRCHYITDFAALC